MPPALQADELLAMLRVACAPRRRRYKNRNIKRRKTVNVVAGMKWCPHCARRKRLASFAKCAYRRDGYQGWCRRCRAAAERARRTLTREREIAR